MNESKFLKAIETNPRDHTPRLIYADWLDQQGDPRGEFLRLACAYDTLPVTEVGLGRALTKLEEIEPEIDPDWVSSVMVGQVWLRYHKRAFSLLGEKPVISKNNVRKIERWEKKVGHQLPASLREWYSLEGAEKRLECDHEFGTTTLQRTLNRAAKSLDPESRTYHRLELFSSSNAPDHYVRPWTLTVGWYSQRACEVSLEESDDPPVDPADAEETKTFSELVDTLLWSKLTQTWWDYEYEYGWGPRSSRVLYSDLPMLHSCELSFNRRDISHLANHFIKRFHRTVDGRWQDCIDPFTQETFTSFKPTSLFHFYTSGVRLKITCLGNPNKRQVESHWEIFGDSVQDLVDIVSQHLWNHGTLSKTLMASNEGGEAALEMLRSRNF